MKTVKQQHFTSTHGLKVAVFTHNPTYRLLRMCPHDKVTHSVLSPVTHTLSFHNKHTVNKYLPQSDIKKDTKGKKHTFSALC